MSLLQDNRRVEGSSKKIYIFCGVGIVALLFIIIILLAMMSVLKKNKVTLVINGQNCETKNYLMKKDDTIYIGLESLTNAIAKGGYTYKRGNKEIEDVNQCYITNTSIHESVFFKVGSDEIYKTVEDSNDVVHYTISKPVIKENEKIYIPINDCKLALNIKITKNNNQYILSSMEYLESYYNRQASNTFVPDGSIVWDTLADNKKLLRDSLVIIKDGAGNLGIGSVSLETSDGKKKVSTVKTNQILTPKYKYIRYVEKYEQLIVETSNGRGIVEFKRQDNGEYSIKTLVAPQYDDIKQLDSDRFIISKITGDSTNKVTRYGIINKDGEEVLPIVYQKIGIDLSKYTNNDLENEYVLYDYLIPVKRNDLWGLVNLNGQSIVECTYTNLGCDETNPSTNVLIIPEKELIVVKNDKNYGIINKTGKVVIRPVLTKVYQESENEKKYYMIYNDQKIDIINRLDGKQSTKTSSDETEDKKEESTSDTNKDDTTNKEDEENKDDNSTKVTITDDNTSTENKKTDADESQTKQKNDAKVVIID